MNLPNRLSLGRALLALALVGCMHIYSTPGYILSLAVFTAACLTDYLDGYIARKRGIVTLLGIFLDPVADKLLILAAFIMLSVRGLMPAWVTIVVLLRELAVDSLRLVAAGRSVVIAAGLFGKVKTITQMLTAALLLCTPLLPVLQTPGLILAMLTVGVTLGSGGDYIYRNRKLLLEEGGEP
jgi:CDP-diacylglycerol--glycerol-3-phosphate 3-phosphatidyltransferase